MFFMKSCSYQDTGEITHSQNEFAALLIQDFKTNTFNAHSLVYLLHFQTQLQTLDIHT